MTDQPHLPMREPFALALAERYAAGFAAQALVSAASLTFDYHPDPRGNQYPSSRSLGHRAVNDLINVWIFEPHSRIRTLLAAFDSHDYRQAVADVSGLRGQGMASNIASSFLFPTEKHWWQNDLAYTASLDYDVYGIHYAMALLSCVDTPADVESLFAIAPEREKAVWLIGQRMNLISSMCVNVGPGVEQYVGELFDGNVTAAHKKRLAMMLAEFDTDDGFAALLARSEKKYVEPALLHACASSPDRAGRLLPAATGVVARRLAEEHRRVHAVDDTSAVVSSTPEEARVRATLPTVLVDPPWETITVTGDPQVLVGDTVQRPLTVRWEEGEREDYATSGEPYVPWMSHTESWQGRVDRIKQDTYWGLETLAYAPEELIRPLLTSLPMPRSVWYPERDLRRILGRFDNEGAQFVVDVATAKPAHAAHVLMPIDGTVVAASMSKWLASKTLRGTAIAWFDRHIGTAADDLIATAVGPLGQERLQARRALRFLDRSDHRTTILAAARERGADTESDITALLDTDPLLELPTSMPTLPTWIEPALLPPILTTAADTVPAPEVANFCSMLAISRIDYPYAGLAIAATALDSESVEQFVLGLFERWQRAGHPEQQGWILDALGIVGTDETVRTLTPLLLRWPLQSAHRRADMGLTVLAAIGTDTALSALWRIAQGLRFPALKAKAEAHIERIADEMGLTPDELADRLVPDLDLTPDGSLDIDYGTRTFAIRLDARLQPIIIAGDGTIRRSLPRPAATDSETARDSYQRFLRFRKVLTPIAAELIERFEDAMITRRSWPLADVRAHLLTHPLTSIICRGVIWQVDDGRTFRLTDFGAAVDSTDDEIAVAVDAHVSIAHPAQFEDPMLPWRATTAEHFEVQPFAQLTRRVFTPREAEALTSSYTNTKTSTEELLAMSSRGWRREAPQDKGAQIALHNYRGHSVVATIMVYPGFNIVNPTQWATQRIVHVSLTANTPDPVELSELARDLATINVAALTGDEPELEGFDSI
ncbi:DUF4132 domain-containing protein [Rhodococcoides yunnanense]|uniref:DUF4132 domain-containing protein n=1 Tax=Rhodococcoides yunnanense TaxID=278209 RepID=UPI001472B17C|nr:DUF4132 domain-containing protein [Rhodococcus yunnanensis]